MLHLMQQPVPTCTGKSIGFLPLNVRAPTPDEISKRPQLRGAKVIDRWVGVEYAVVPVPCNPDAEMQAVAKGMELGLIDEKLMRVISESSQPGARQGLAKALIRSRIRRAIHEHFRELTGKVS